MFSAFSSKAPWQTFFGLVALLAVVAAPSTAEARGPVSVADLAEQLSGAVVNISTTQKVKTTSGNSQRSPVPNLPENSPFRDFFKDFFDNQPGQRGQRQPRRPRRANSLGSGFVVDPEGIVITNNHVIADAAEITVNFADGTKLEAELIGRDSKTDIAVLKVKPEKPLQAVEFGDSKSLRVGDWVMAIGNPFGLGGCVTLNFGQLFGKDNRRVTLDERMEQGPEAAAREARYRALDEFVKEDDWLLSGHHENDQAETLHAQGCDYLQGFLFCKPAPAADVAEYLNSHHVVPEANAGNADE